MPYSHEHDQPPPVYVFNDARLYFRLRVRKNVSPEYAPLLLRSAWLLAHVIVHHITRRLDVLIFLDADLH